MRAGIRTGFGYRWDLCPEWLAGHYAYEDRKIMANRDDDDVKMVEGMRTLNSHAGAGSSRDRT